GLDESLVGCGPTVMDGNPMMVVPKVAATNHGCDQSVTAGLGELPEHRQPDPRSRVQFPAAFPADALRQLGSHELPERPAHVGEAKARPLRDLNRRLRARDDGRENFLPLPAREDEGEFVEHVQRFAPPRPMRAARGAAIAVARTADITRRRSDAGAAHASGHGARSPASPRTAAAAPLRARWMMNRTATLRSAVDVETAPKTTMN